MRKLVGSTGNNSHSVLAHSGEVFGALCNLQKVNYSSFLSSSTTCSKEFLQKRVRRTFHVSDSMLERGAHLFIFIFVFILEWTVQHRNRTELFLLLLVWPLLSPFIKSIRIHQYPNTWAMFIRLK